jgi:hypothetical protein
MQSIGGAHAPAVSLKNEKTGNFAQFLLACTAPTGAAPFLLTVTKQGEIGPHFAGTVDIARNRAIIGGNVSIT